VVGLLDELVIAELDLRRRGFQCFVADPNLWVPFEDGTAFGQWLDDERTERNLRDLGVVPKDIEGYWAYEHLFDEIRRRLRTGARDTWVGETPTRAEIEELLGGEQTMLDVVFSASIAEVLDDHMSDQRLKDALFGQGVIAAYGGPKDAGTASIKLMHYQGDLEGQGPVWGYVQGGMGMVSFAPAPPGKHLLSVFGQYAPYDLADGTWDSRREEVARQFIDLIDRFAPGFEARIEAYEVLGPLDIEQRIGLTGGNIFQGEVTPDQMWERRLTPRTPVTGLYLCGAATHPGGSVIALNGRNAAMAVLADARELAVR
jgi:phytoene dehydrogenase-like protein